ncbi:rod shape-determining protein RodA [Nitrincola sp. A-D6]|uniref:rod shape-determining protein RodA n=1 Tax=Nitrincola sp. A-D6 TaxID=1545442 RepID=UPI00051FA061|nr:rod shape-determining protein RodA [Nitrincola sp. A-D6]KGK41437.1 rod shape-determining protein RodA [Nitrincola sp. A-D6]
MSSRDFQRTMPGASTHFRRSPGWWSYTHLDAWLLLLLLALCSFGLYVLYSASSQDMLYVQRQMIRMAAGFAVLIFLAQIRPRSFMLLAPWLYLLGVGFLVAVMLFGVSAKGAQRWIALPGFRFQPSELMKLVIPMAMAAFLVRDHLPPSLKRLMVAVVILAIPAALIMKQPDLGTSLLIACSGVFVILLSGIYWRYVIVALGLIGAALPVFWSFMKPYQQQRVLTFLNPESDPLGSGWNIIQSKTAIGSGGVSGKGWLQGTQSQLNFLPESHTDFIIAVIGEELGIYGIIFLILLYLLIIARGLIIAARGADSFSRLLAGSVTLTFFVYVMVNIGMVTGLLPVVGVPLPMISYGGTSIVTLMAGFGILMSVSAHSKVHRH